MTSPLVLILPGWQNSGPEHWQSRWQAAHGYTRVEQHDWQRPLRGDWIARLEDVLLSHQALARHAAQGPAVLVAHSLGCLTVAAWAAHSRNTHRIKAALLVAPPDTERGDIGQMLPGWAPVPLARLPFHAAVYASSNDPFCDASRARQMANAWGADWVDAGPRGHLNADSGLGDWPVLHAHLQSLLAATFQPPPGQPANPSINPPINLPNQPPPV